MIKGQKYIFNQNNSSNNTHPIALSTTSNGTHGSGTQYTSGWTYTGTAGTDGIATFVVPHNSPDTLYYYCVNHSGMGANILIKVLTANSLKGQQGLYWFPRFSLVSKVLLAIQGFTGFQGFQGYTGYTGFQGFQGYTGYTGFQGFQGYTGHQGFTGFQGQIYDSTVDLDCKDISANDASFNNIDVNSIGAFTLKGDIIPDVADTYTIGSSTHPIKDLYLGANSLYVNNKKIIEDDSDTIIISTDADQHLTLKTTGTGTSTLQSGKQINITTTANDGHLIVTTNGSGDIELNTNTGNIKLMGNILIEDTKNISNNSSGNSIRFNDSIQMVGSNKLIGDVTGNVSGTAATVTGAAQSNITSVGTLTALQVDNVNIDGNTIKSTTGNLKLNPNTGSAVIIDETINIDAGVVTGATSITSTTFVGTLSGNATTANNLSGSKTANHIYAAPNGSNGSATFRALVAADIPTLNQDTTGNAGSVTNGVYTTGNQTIAGNKTFSDILTITGSLIFNGTATTLNSTNTTISDNLLLLNDGVTGNNANDSGILIDRGDLDSAFMGWDEDSDKFIFGTTTTSGSDFNDVTNLTYQTIKASTFEGALSGNATTATNLSGSQTANYVYAITKWK